MSPPMYQKRMPQSYLYKISDSISLLMQIFFLSLKFILTVSRTNPFQSFMLPISSTPGRISSAIFETSTFENIFSKKIYLLRSTKENNDLLLHFFAHVGKMWKNSDKRKSQVIDCSILSFHFCIRNRL